MYLILPFEAYYSKLKYSIEFYKQIERHRYAILINIFIVYYAVKIVSKLLP